MSCRRLLSKMLTWCGLRPLKLRALFITILCMSSCLLLWMSEHWPPRFRNSLQNVNKKLIFHQIPKAPFSIATASTIERNYRTSDGTCVHPQLNPYDPAVMQFYDSTKPFICSSMINWVYVNNGTFHISPAAVQVYGNITCDYAPISRSGDFKVNYGPHVKPMLDGTPLKADFFQVNCESANGKTYENVHSGVARNPAVMARLHDYHPHTDHPSQKIAPDDSSTPPSISQLNLSVFMFGFDSMSHMSWIRLLPKTRRYYLGTLGGIELQGYNVVGDGTPSALLPILTGKLEEDLPETRRGFPGATTVDNHPWIWKDFTKRGYVTAWAEDMASVGTFQYRLLGFREPPTDHYMRPFYLAAEATYWKNAKMCLGSTPRHVNFMNWFRQLFDAYTNFPKFFFGFHSELSHDSNNPVQSLDDDLLNFLQDLETKGHLNSTLLILMADHGARYDFIRATAQGRLEERMPHFSFRFPPWFHKLYPNIIKNMRTNVNRLTTPYDIHATFHDILNFTTEAGDVRNRGISLLKEIPKDRTCSHARVAPHWCACLAWQDVDQSDPLVVLAVDSVIRTINNYTQGQRRHCAELRLQEITKSSRYVPNSSDRSAESVVLKYNKLSSPSLTHHYQVSFKTLPGEGHFEVTCELDLKNATFTVNSDQISRINKYGSQPACIQDTLPHLRPYCYCR